MIRFVCASCGERLSVSDQQAGRRGQCPTCQGINRIPLKGFIEPRPSSTPAVNGPQAADQIAPPIAPPVAAPIASEARFLEPQTQEGSILRQENSPSPGTPGEGRGEGLSADERQDPHPIPLPEYRERGQERTLPAQGKPDDADPIFSSTHPDPLAQAPGRDNPRRLAPHRPLPRRLKQFLLLLAAIGVAGALYFGLLFALHLVLRAVSP